MMKLSTTDLRLLHAIYSDKTRLDQIAQAIDVSIYRVSAVASRLVELGFLEKEKYGRSVSLHFSDHIFIENLKQLYARKLQVEKMLSGSHLPILLARIIPEMKNRTDRSGWNGLPVQDIASLSGFSRVTVHNALKELMMTGALLRERRFYSISASMTELKAFLRNFSQFLTTQIINDISKQVGKSESNFILRYSAGGEMIFSVRDHIPVMNIENFEPTAITAFAEYDLPFLSDSTFYHYSLGGRPLVIENKIIDVLLPDPSSPRNIIYALLFLQRDRPQIHRDVMMKLGKLFGIQDLVENMYDFLERFPNEKGIVPKGFPKPREFQELCNMYGVVIHAS